MPPIYIAYLRHAFCESGIAYATNVLSLKGRKELWRSRRNIPIQCALQRNTKQIILAFQRRWQDLVDKNPLGQNQIVIRITSFRDWYKKRLHISRVWSLFLFFIADLVYGKKYYNPDFDEPRPKSWIPESAFSAARSEICKIIDDTPLLAAGNFISFQIIIPALFEKGISHQRKIFCQNR